MTMNNKSPLDLSIRTREIDIDYYSALKTTPNWHSDDPVISHFFSALQSTFPEGERFFIDAARDVRDKHKDQLSPKLLEQIKLFIQQEAFHGQTHDQWCQALIELGYPRLVDFDQELKDLREHARKNVPSLVRLSITSAVEHYTASLAHLFLNRREFLDGASKPLQYVLLYHALEEVEHKAVCFDLYQAAGGSYALRALGLFVASMDIAYQARKRHIYLLKQSGNWSFKHRLKAWSLAWGSKGIVWSLLPYSLRYLSPSFHPWNTDERPALDELYGSILAERDMSVYPS